MYLVPAEKYSEARKKFPSGPPTHTVSISSASAKEEEEDEKEEDKKQKRHPYEKWVKYRKKMREDEIRRMTQMDAIADYLQKVLLVSPTTPPPPAIAKAPPTTRCLAFGTQTTPEKKKNKLSPHHNPRLQLRKHSPLRQSQVSQKSVTTTTTTMIIMFS